MIGSEHHRGPLRAQQYRENRRPSNRSRRPQHRRGVRRPDHGKIFVTSAAHGAIDEPPQASPITTQIPARRRGRSPILHSVATFPAVSNSAPRGVPTTEWATEQEFEALYDRLAPAVYGTTLRVVRDPAQAEEVCQEVFVEIWRTFSRYDPRLGSERTWALTMAHRRAVDRVRSTQALRDREERAGVLEGNRGTDHMADVVDGMAEREQVREALGALTPLQREAVVLAYYGGLTQQEVALRLGVPLGTVKTRLRDGLIRLRDSFASSTA
jgi:RNA polymerase sigma-70 factor (ECF subfamily)